MAKLLQTLITLLFCIALFLMLANKATSQKTSFTFTSFVANSTDLTYQGDAHVPAGAQSLRLTKTDANGLPRPLSVGRVLYSKPFKLWEKSLVASFNTTIKFTITTTKGPGADGLAFFMAPVGTTIPAGSYGGSLGLFDSSGKNEFFAVEFDLYCNGWDPSHDLPHIGIDINSIKSSSFVQFGDSCVGKEAQLHIHYDGINFIEVSLKCDKETRLLEYEYDLGEILPSQVQVGIASSTGDLVALHDINYWSFRSA